MLEAIQEESRRGEGEQRGGRMQMLAPRSKTEFILFSTHLSWQVARHSLRLTSDWN